MSRLHHTATVLDYFNVIFGKNTIERTVEQTNLYVVQKKPGESYKWSDKTELEICYFLGIVIALGVHPLPSLSDYWSNDPLLSVPAIHLPFLLALPNPSASFSLLFLFLISFTAFSSHEFCSLSILFSLFSFFYWSSALRPSKTSSSVRQTVFWSIPAFLSVQTCL